VTECPWLHQPQDDHALTLVDDGVDDQPGAAAVGGRPLVGELVVALAGLARVLQQLHDPRADLIAGVLGQAGVVNRPGFARGWGSGHLAPLGDGVSIHDFPLNWRHVVD